jgi:aspartyl-tRNA(Asn)/glutamyl-tRNA(Gln) amidotransferase subunit A
VEPVVSAKDLDWLPLSELAQLVGTGTVSPVQVVEASLDSIARQDSTLHAFTYLDSHEALRQARIADAEIRGGTYRGPLHGIPIAHKDLLHVKGMRTSAGSRVSGTDKQNQDSGVVSLLRQAGAIVVGKLNLTEFGSGTMGLFGEALNPWNLTASPGTSSSGSGVAVAAGYLSMATGTDTGGSLRMPASFCGLVGMRPTYGRVSRAGSIPLSWSQDTIGGITRTVQDAVTVLQIMSEPFLPDVDPGSNAAAADIVGLRVGIPSSFFEDLHPEVDAAIQTAIGELGALGVQFVDIDLPMCKFASAASWVISYTEAFAYHRRGFEQHPSLYTPAFLTKLASAALISSDEAILAHQVRELVTNELLSTLSDVDAILTPTHRTLASDLSRISRASEDLTDTLRMASLSGLPALTIPIGFAADSTPMGMQLIGPPWQEAMLFRIGNAYERTQPWTTMHPLPATASSFPASDPAPLQAGLVDTEWVLDAARLLNYEFIHQEHAPAIATTLSVVRLQLSEARRVVDREIEPATRPAPAGF